MVSADEDLDDGEVYSDSETERKMKKKRRRDSPSENMDDENEEARLRARLLARQAEKDKEKGKKSDKHHHKKKKKRRDSSPSVVEMVDLEKFSAPVHHHDEELEEGLNIQPPQLPTSSTAASASASHRKKHKKNKEKHKNDDLDLERYRQKDRKEERIEITYSDPDEKKDRRAREGWAAWQRSLVPIGRPVDSFRSSAAARVPPPLDGKSHSWNDRDRRNERLERFRTVEDPIKSRGDVFVRTERHRGDERIRRSRSPTDRRPRRASPTRVHHERKISPIRAPTTKNTKPSREGRWLPQVNRETASDRSSSVTKTTSSDKGSTSSKERALPRIKITEPSHSVSPSSTLLLETTAETVQQSTPTQDELEDKETEVLSAVSKSGSSDSGSNQSSSSSSPNATDDGESLESGERRSEKSDDQCKKGVAKQYYSKFDSSPEVDDGLSDREDVTIEVEDQGEPEPIVSDDDVEKPLENEAVEPLTPEMEIKEEREPELPIYYPATMGCRYVEEFDCLNRIEEGTYGVVYRAKEKRTNEIVALKRLKMEKEKEGFPITSLREINMLLKAGNHANIVNVREIVVGSNMDKIYLVMDYVEHDMKSLMETMKQPFLVGEVKTLLRQLMSGVHHLHDNWILHRDLKTSNLLLSHKGILKIGDFGLAREYGSPLKPYTPIVVTLWYRAPELLLGTKEYSTKIDMWSVGCIFAEFVTLKPLFTGKSEIEQLNKMFKMLGTPNNKIWEGYDELPGVKKMQFVEYPYNSLRKHFGATLSDKGFNLLNKLLTYDPVKRITAKSGLMDEWFDEEPRPVHPDMFPTWPAKSELSKTARKSSPKPPSGGKQYKQMVESDKDLMAGLRVKPTNHGHGNQTAGFSLKFDAPKFR